MGGIFSAGVFFRRAFGPHLQMEPTGWDLTRALRALMSRMDGMPGMQEQFPVRGVAPSFGRPDSFPTNR